MQENVGMYTTCTGNSIYLMHWCTTVTGQEVEMSCTQRKWTHKGNVTCWVRKCANEHVGKISISGNSWFGPVLVARPWLPVSSVGYLHHPSGPPITFSLFPVHDIERHVNIYQALPVQIPEMNDFQNIYCQEMLLEKIQYALLFPV